MTKIERLSCQDAQIARDALIDYICESNQMAAHMGSYQREDAQMKYQELLEYLKAGKAVSFGAWDRERLTGFVWAYEYPFREDLSRIYVSILHVHRDYRGRGIGKELLSAVEAEAAARGLGSVYLHAEAENHRSLRFYQRMGYHKERVQLCKSSLGSRENIPESSGGGENSGSDSGTGPEVFG